MKKKLLFSLFCFCFLPLFSCSARMVDDEGLSTESLEKKYPSNFMPSSRDVFGAGEEGLFKDQRHIIKDYTGDQSATGEFLIRRVIETIISYLKKLLAPIAILLLSWSGTYLFLARANEDEFKKRKNEVFGMFAGFAIILLSASLIDNVFFGSEGQIFRDSCEGGKENCINQFEQNIQGFAANGVAEIKGVLNFVTSFATIVAVAFLIFSTYSLIISGENEDEAEKAKKRVLFAIIGMAVIISSQSFVSAITDPAGKLKMPDAAAIIGLGGYWSNKILGFIGLISVSALVWAGFQMVVNFGDDERVENGKKIFKFVIIGLVVAFSLWTIVRYFLTAGAPYNMT